MTVTTEDGVNFVDDGKCPICGAETHMGNVTYGITDGSRAGGFEMFEIVECPNCGDVTDAVFDGMAVRWEDLDHSHDDEVSGASLWQTVKDNPDVYGALPDDDGFED